MKLKDTCSLEESYDKPRLHIKKQRHYFADKGPYSPAYGFSSIHVWMCEFDHRECWVLKNWCFQTSVLKKTLESPLDCNEIKPVNPKGNQPWIFIGRTDAEAPILWPHYGKGRLIGKVLMLERQKVGGEEDGRGWGGWIESLFQWTWVWVSSGRWWEQGFLVCCRPWGREELDTTEQLSSELTPVFLPREFHG